MATITDWFEITEKCTGCGACEQICSNQAIRMEFADNGFWYPKIRDDLCIQCGKCYLVCKLRTEKPANKKEPLESYAAWSNDELLRYTSTSGGVFSEIAKVILSDGGVVVGAAYEGINVVHKVCINVAELDEIKQSKYVQSKIGDIYIKIRDYMDQEKNVLFAGTPCQVAGLYSFLGSKNERLITISFICRGVCSPIAFRKWVNEYEEKNGSKIKSIWFKYKSNGWKASPRNTRILFENGKIINVTGNDNMYMGAYLDINTIIRPSCGNCDFKGNMHPEDITLADFWHVDSKYDDDRGTSAVIVNSEKGKMYVDRVIRSNHLSSFRCKYSDIVSGNSMFVSSVKRAADSDYFISLLDENSFSDAYELFKK